MCVRAPSMIATKDASESVCSRMGLGVCMLLVLSGVCETGVIELRGFSVFGGRGEIGIFRIH